MSNQAKHFYDVGAYRVDVSDRLLLRGTEVVPLTPKALELLMVLVASNGQLLTKEELMKRVWPDSFVEEANLSHNIYKLREALGEGRDGGKYIETLPRRGYRFVAKVTEVRSEQAAEEQLSIAEQTRTHVVIEEEDEGSDIIREAGELSAANSKALTADSRAEHQRTWARRAVLAVGCVVLAGLVFGGYQLWKNKSRPFPEQLLARSIAVLPFKPLVLENRDPALELGMTDALITKLSNIREMVVRPTSAVLKYSDAAQDPLAAGREQEVDVVLDGKVQRAGDRVRVTVQLVRVSDGVALWGREFDGGFTSIFSLQDSISEQVAQALTLHLSSEEQKRLTNRYTANIEAYQLYLQGRHFMEKRTVEDIRRSLNYYQQAIDIDANYALAYSGLAYSYHLLASEKALSPDEAYPQGKKAALRALELDPALAEGYIALARIKEAYDRDAAGAGEDYRRAIEFNPNHASARRNYSTFLMRSGRIDEALQEARKAQEIDPLLLVANANLAEVNYYAHQWDQTLKYMRRVREIDPGFQPSMVGNYLYLSYMRKGMYEEAILENAKRLSDGASPEQRPTRWFRYARHTGSVGSEESGRSRLNWRRNNKAEIVT